MTKPVDHREYLPPAGVYRIEPERTMIRFRTRAIFGLLPVRGTYRVTGGHIRVGDPVESSAVSVSISSASFDSGNEERDRHVRSADFLAADEHPDITFHAQRVRLDEPGKPATVDGELTVRGVRRPVVLLVLSVRPAGDDRRLVVKAKTTVDRYVFGITKSKGFTGRRQILELDVVAAR